MKDHIKPSYYMKSLQYYYALTNLNCPLTKIYKEHFVQSLASIKYIKKLRIPSDENLTKSQLQLARLDEQLTESKTLNNKRKDDSVRS